VMSAVICRQNVLQRALNPSQQLVVRLAQTQPVTAKTQPTTATCCSAHVNGTDPSISLFYRPFKASIDSSDICETADHSAITCRCSGEVIDVCFNETLKESLHDVQQKIREEAFHSEAIRVESIDELIHREAKPSYEYMSLPRLYAKLAKLRLTGELHRVNLYLSVVCLLSRFSCKVNCVECTKPLTRLYYS